VAKPRAKQAGEIERIHLSGKCGRV
jgi:hypothetical protein